jgi:hypothetical protein
VTIAWGRGQRGPFHGSERRASRSPAPIRGTGIDRPEFRAGGPPLGIFLCPNMLPTASARNALRRDRHGPCQRGTTLGARRPRSPRKPVSCNYRGAAATPVLGAGWKGRTAPRRRSRRDRSPLDRSQREGIVGRTVELMKVAIVGVGPRGHTATPLGLLLRTA